MSDKEGSKTLKMQTCVLKVNTCCVGCQKKINKVLHKIDGVEGIHLDAGGGKVTVTGNVAPAVLITKLRKAGKIAELLHPKSGNQKNTENVKSQKGGGEGRKWFKNLKFPRFTDLKLPFKKKKEEVKFDILPKEESGDVKKKKKKKGGGGGEGGGVQVQKKGGVSSPVVLTHGGVMPPEMTAGFNPYHRQQQQRMMMMMNGQDTVGYGYGHTGYVPPPPPPPPREESYSNMFSDENPNSCSVM
ncbi:heavy metal-associated domain containing protein [Musa troglodytarum]|uniref:Heavy metal-associated domain containing protein n=1 Tax=Musa troglodytarum TaxID=320322 RepID=A0A9E7EMM9_9LILI|nr:heavy metal-associated domain containing protein [Musa troglodytarum]